MVQETDPHAQPCPKRDGEKHNFVQENCSEQWRNGEPVKFVTSRCQYCGAKIGQVVKP